jgi:hypothetical protein
MLEGCLWPRYHAAHEVIILVDILTTPPVEVWSGCDPEFGEAVGALSRAWGPYSRESRRYPIFKLLRELIDPAWLGLCRRSGALNGGLLNLAWTRYTRELVSRVDSVNVTGLDGTSPPSELARRLGFSELDLFMDYVGEVCDVFGDDQLLRSIDTMREVALRCLGKGKKRTSLGKFHKVELLDGMRICRSCGLPTELADHKAMGDAAPESAAQPSSRYCSKHSPKQQGLGSRSDYLQAWRSQKAFEVELHRLGCQYASSRSPHARSGKPLVDKFFQLLAASRVVVKADDVDIHDLERRLSAEARMLVDGRVTDREKEMIALLSEGKNQSQVADQLGVTRQAISKALISMPGRYRFDLSPAG